jgi:hypothetical protein
MACPMCKCKACYQFDDVGDDYQSDYPLERCAMCGNVFDVLEALDDDDDYYFNTTTPKEG